MATALRPYDRVVAAECSGGPGLGTMTRASAQRDSQILEHMPHVEATARRVFQHLPDFRKQPALFDDLVSVGALGLIAAVDSFAASSGLKLRTFAQYKIRGAMLDWLREQDWAPRRVRERWKLIKSAERSLRTTLGRRPTEYEIAGRLGLPTSEYRGWLLETQRVNLLSLDGDLGGFSSAPTASSTPHVDLEEAELRTKLFTLLQELPAVERTVLKLHYIDGLSGRQIAARTALHESRVSRLKTQAIARLRSALAAEELPPPATPEAIMRPAPPARA